MRLSCVVVAGMVAQEWLEMADLGIVWQYTSWFQRRHVPHAQGALWLGS